MRKKVQGLLNSSLTFGEEVSAEEARELLEQISNLNQAIEDAEEALVATLLLKGKG